MGNTCYEDAVFTRWHHLSAAIQLGTLRARHLHRSPQRLLTCSKLLNLPWAMTVSYKLFVHFPLHHTRKPVSGKRAVRLSHYHWRPFQNWRAVHCRLLAGVSWQWWGWLPVLRDLERKKHAHKEIQTAVLSQQDLWRNGSSLFLGFYAASRCKEWGHKKERLEAQTQRTGVSLPCSIDALDSDSDLRCFAESIKSPASR